ncbi:MAG: DUF6064 family protein [Gemmatimonadales bacterium]
MRVPFTLDQFLDVFAAYNRSLWPAALLLWLATVAITVLLVRRHRSSTRATSLLLAVHWGWAGVAYHLAFFRSINPAAVLFGAFFVVQAVLFLWWARRAPSTALRQPSDPWRMLGLSIIAYSLAYPLLGLAFGLSYPRMPTFGVPCPTTLYTIGVLLIARASIPRWLAFIPLAWTAVGGSAAFLFDVRADLLLPAAGAALLLSLIRAAARTTRIP